MFDIFYWLAQKRKILYPQSLAIIIHYNSIEY